MLVQIKKQNGDSLVEVLVALALVCFMFTSLMNIAFDTLVQSKINQGQVTANYIAEKNLLSEIEDNIERGSETWGGANYSKPIAENNLQKNGVTYTGDVDVTSPSSCEMDVQVNVKWSYENSFAQTVFTGYQKSDTTSVSQAVYRNNCS